MKIQYQSIKCKVNIIFAGSPKLIRGVSAGFWDSAFSSVRHLSEATWLRIHMYIKRNTEERSFDFCTDVSILLCQTDRLGSSQALQWIFLEYPDPQGAVRDGEESCYRGKQHITIYCIY